MWECNEKKSCQNMTLRDSGWKDCGIRCFTRKKGIWKDTHETKKSFHISVKKGRLRKENLFCRKYNTTCHFLLVDCINEDCKKIIFFLFKLGDSKARLLVMDSQILELKYLRNPNMSRGGNPISVWNPAKIRPKNSLGFVFRDYFKELFFIWITQPSFFASKRISITHLSYLFYHILWRY